MNHKPLNASSMAKKRRLKHACQYCHERFASPQAKWGHYPQCKARKLSLDPASKPEAQPPHSSVADRESRRPGPDNQDMKLLLLDVNEDATQLERDAGDHAFWAQWIARTDPTHAQGKTTPEEWVMIYQDLGNVTRDLDLMVGPFTARSVPAV